MALVGKARDKMVYRHIKRSDKLLERMRWGHRLLDASEAVEVRVVGLVEYHVCH